MISNIVRVFGSLPVALKVLVILVGLVVLPVVAALLVLLSPLFAVLALILLVASAVAEWISTELWSQRGGGTRRSFFSSSLATDAR
jgi:hypothetical protein